MLIRTTTRMFDTDLESLHAVRLRCLDLIRPLSQADLDRIPALGKWSVGEIVDHIILAGELLQRKMEDLIWLKRSGQRPFLRQTFSDIDVGFSFIPKALMPLVDIPFTFFSSFLIGPVRDFVVKHRLILFRAATEAMPRYGLPADELHRRLLSSFAALRLIFENNADLDFRELVAQHSLLGYQNMLELLRFMRNHELRHQQQILEVIDANRRIGGHP
jgi:hypothetical protein